MPIGAAGLPGRVACRRAGSDHPANLSVVQADLYVGAIVVLGEDPCTSASLHRATARLRVTSLGSTPGAATPEKSYEPLAPSPAYCQGVLGHALFSLNEPGLRARRCAYVRAFPGVERRNGAHEHRRATPPPDRSAPARPRRRDKGTSPPGGRLGPVLTTRQQQPCPGGRRCAVVDTHGMKLYSGRDRSGLSVDRAQVPRSALVRVIAADESIERGMMPSAGQRIEPIPGRKIGGRTGEKTGACSGAGTGTEPAPSA
jgi:hypothetical protein